MRLIKKIVFWTLLVIAVAAASLGTWDAYNTAYQTLGVTFGGEPLEVESLIAFYGRDIGLILFSCFLGILLLLIQNSTPTSNGQ